MIQYPRRVMAFAAVLLLAGCAAPASAPRYGYWSYVHTPLPAFWWHARVDVPGAQAKAGTGAGASVAIIGTGVRKGHEELPTVVPGHSVCTPPDTQDENGHGTQLAGIVAGRDSTVTRGVAPRVAVIPIKVDCGVVSARGLIQGVDEAIKRTPDIILIAIGGYPASEAGTPDVFSELLHRVTKNAQILFVVASAWDGTYYAFPPWTTADNALLVAAMTLDADPRDRTRVRTDKEIPYSARRGAIWAPGRAVETASIETDPGSQKYSQFLMHGTSPAAAIVAGCAALVKSKTRVGGVALKQALLRAAEPKPDLGSTPDNGRLNCAAAIP